MSGPDSPAVRLRHLLDLFADQPDTDVAFDAYPEANDARLTWGDLRAIAAQIGA